MRRVFALFAVLLGASSCNEEAPIDPKLGVLRPATPLASAQPAPRAYRVREGSVLRFEVPSPGGRPSGQIRAISGTVHVDLMNLRTTRASLAADLLSLETSESLPSIEDATKTTLEWLGLGRERPSPERESRRFATFDLHRVVDVSTPAAHQGTLNAAKTPAGSGADGGIDGHEAGAEDRTLRLVAAGDLTLNARRATIELPMAVTFRYPEPSLSGVEPREIVLESTRPATLEMGLFDIQPRDARGTVLAAQVSASRKTLGQNVLVSARLILVPDGSGPSRGWRAGEAD